jgi:hypothetical protein
MEKENVLTVRERMENVLRSAGEALVNGMNLKTVVRQLDESGLKIVETPFNTRVITNSNVIEIGNEVINFREIEDRKMLVYNLSFGFENEFEI